MGYLFAITTLLSWSVGTFFFATAARKIDAGLLNKTRLFLAAVATAILVWVTSSVMIWEIITLPTVQQWMWLGLSGLVGLTIGDLFGFTSLKILGARRQSVISTASPAAAALIGWILLAETLSVLAILGMLVTIGGVMFALSSDSEQADVHAEGYGSYSAGILLGIGGAVCQGLGIVFAKKAFLSGQPLQPMHATFMRMSTAFLLTYLVDAFRRAPNLKMKSTLENKTGFRAMLMGVLLGPIIGVTASLAAVKHINVAIAQTIFSLSPFLVITIARIAHKEPIRLRSVLGAVIAVLGVIMLLEKEIRVLLKF